MAYHRLWTVMACAVTAVCGIVAALFLGAGLAISLVMAAAVLGAATGLTLGSELPQPRRVAATAAELSAAATLVLLGSAQWVGAWSVLVLTVMTISHPAALKRLELRGRRRLRGTGS